MTMRVKVMKKVGEWRGKEGKKASPTHQERSYFPLDCIIGKTLPWSFYKESLGRTNFD